MFAKIAIVCALSYLSEAQRFDSNPWNRPPTAYEYMPSTTPPPDLRPAMIPETSLTCGPATQAYIAVSGMCDAYIQCLNGVSEEITCLDGLRFNPEARYPDYPCGYPKDVPCLGRAGLQPAQPTADCPHQYGYFRTADARNCGRYRMCVLGIGYNFNCPEGLAYEEKSYACEWADLVPGCDVEQYIGFTCPAMTPQLDENGAPVIVNVYYKHPTDCRKYYDCNNGMPRLLSCPKGQAFDERSMSCKTSASCI